MASAKRLQSHLVFTEMGGNSADFACETSQDSNKIGPVKNVVAFQREG